MRNVTLHKLLCRQSTQHRIHSTYVYNFLKRPPFLFYDFGASIDKSFFRVSRPTLNLNYYILHSIFRVIMQSQWLNTTFTLIIMCAHYRMLWLYGKSWNLNNISSLRYNGNSYDRYIFAGSRYYSVQLH